MLLLLACQSPDPTPDSVRCDPVGWDAWGYGFFAENCNACHSLGAQGAPTEPRFDDYEQVVASSERIRARVLEERTMPPAGGVVEADRSRLEAFLDCPEPGEGAGSWSPQEPAWGREEAEGALLEALHRPLPDPYTLRSTYLDLLALGDATCPGEDADLGPPEVSLEGCTAASGVRYAGVSTWAEGAFSSIRADFELRNGDFTITDADGQAFTAGGTFFFFAEGGGGQGNARFELDGSFVYGPAGGWLGEGDSAVLTVDRFGSRVELDGGLGLQVAELYLDGLALESCGATGGLALRGPEGGWYRSELVCDCGSLAFGDRELGEICVDSAGFRAGWLAGTALP